MIVYLDATVDEIIRFGVCVQYLHCLYVCTVIQEQLYQFRKTSIMIKEQIQQLNSRYSTVISQPESLYTLSRPILSHFILIAKSYLHSSSLTLPLCLCIINFHTMSTFLSVRPCHYPSPPASKSQRLSLSATHVLYLLPSPNSIYADQNCMASCN